MKSLFLFCAFVCTTLSAQTKISPSQVPWSQLDWSSCGGTITSGTRLKLNQVKAPAGVADPCWASNFQTQAWKVLNTKCIRCHGADLIPGDTHLVGGLDLRTYAAMRRGGLRGPAMVPGNAAASLVYVFSSLGFAMPPTSADVARLDALDAIFPQGVLGMPPAGPLSIADITALRAWINAGAPALR